MLNVKNLSRNVTDAHLKEIFGHCGLVKKSEVAIDPEVKLSKGTATVEFVARDFAMAAVQHLDGAQVDGMKMRVVLADKDDGSADPAPTYRRAFDERNRGPPGRRDEAPRGRGPPPPPGGGSSRAPPPYQQHDPRGPPPRGAFDRGPPPPPPRRDSRDGRGGPPPPPPFRERDHGHRRERGDYPRGRDYGRERDYDRGPPPPRRPSDRDYMPPPRRMSRSRSPGPRDGRGRGRERGRSRSRSSGSRSMSG